MRIPKLKGALRNDSGSDLVEFSLCAMVFFTVILGICDVSRAMYGYHFATYAAQRGSRYAMVRGASWGSSCSTSAPPDFTLNFKCTATSSDVQNYVKSLGAINPANVTATTTWPGTTPDCSSNCTACTTTNSQGCMVKVKVTYKFQFIVPFIDQTSVNFTGTSEKAIQQ